MMTEKEKQAFKAGYLCGVKSSYLYLHNNFLDALNTKAYELIEELFDFISKNVDDIIENRKDVCIDPCTKKFYLKSRDKNEN